MNAQAKPVRDMTRAQFRAALKRNGIKQGAFGYFDVTDRLMVYARNGGDSRRAQIAYLIRKRDADLDEQRAERAGARP
jgi:hypothetical protein